MMGSFCRDSRYYESSLASGPVFKAWVGPGVQRRNDLPLRVCVWRVGKEFVFRGVMG